MEDIYRPLYVLVYPSPLFAAHWSFWVPELGEDRRELKKGTRIHVTGDRRSGFVYEAEYKYDIDEDDRHPKAYAIGLIAASMISQERKGGDANVNGPQEQVTAFDKACRHIEAPGPSLNKVSNRTSSSDPAPRITEPKDCQWWLKQVVAYLVESNVLLSLDTETGAHGNPVDLTNKLPKH